MSDLAPFVAAVIRDKAVSDLKAENDALKEELRKSRCLQFVAKNGTVIKETAHFLASSAGTTHSTLGFDREEPFPYCAPDCTLSQLKDMMIMVGGVKLATFTSPTAIELEFDDEDVYLTFFSGVCDVSVVIHGWPAEHRDVTFAATDDLLWDYLMNSVPNLTPGIEFNLPSLMISLDWVQLNHTALVLALMKEHTENSPDVLGDN